MATLTVYPSPGVTVDGYALHNEDAQTWATILAGAGTTSADSSAFEELIQIWASTTSNTWRLNRRAIFLFDTSALGASATITAAVMSVFGKDKSDGLSITPDLDAYTSTPASNTALAASDYPNLGTVSQTGSPITYSGWSTSAYNDFTFNATGIGNISKTGISKFGVRNANYDVSGTIPTWSSGAMSYAGGYYSDQTGTANDPKLVITYTPPGPTGVKTIDGVAIASIKTIDGVATSSVKALI